MSKPFDAVKPFIQGFSKLYSSFGSSASDVQKVCNPDNAIDLKFGGTITDEEKGISITEIFKSVRQR